MASIIVNVERWNDTGMAFVRSRASDAPEADKDVIRAIDYNVFEGTCLPADYQLRAGALVTLMMHYPKREVRLIELRAFRNGPLWVADALVADGDQEVVCRGAAANPVEALASLAIDIQQY
jgi:hypothetical protein